MTMNVLIKESKEKAEKKIAPPFTSLPAKFKAPSCVPDSLFCSHMNQKLK